MKAQSTSGKAKSNVYADNNLRPFLKHQNDRAALTRTRNLQGKTTLLLFVHREERMLDFKQPEPQNSHDSCGGLNSLQINKFHKRLKARTRTYTFKPIMKEITK